MKSKLISIVLCLIALAALSGGAVYAAGGIDRVLVHTHSLTINVEPIEVQVMETSNTSIHTGQVVEVTYLIRNHSTQVHCVVVAELEVGSPGLGVPPCPFGASHQWMVVEENKEYMPGTPLVVPSGSARTLKVQIRPSLETIGDMPLNIKIYRISPIAGQG